MNSKMNYCKCLNPMPLVREDGSTATCEEDGNYICDECGYDINPINLKLTGDLYMASFKDLVHKRILVTVKNENWRSSSDKVAELLIMEVSPSGNFVKVRDIDGRRYWNAKENIIPIEVLELTEKSPQNKERSECILENQ